MKHHCLWYALVILTVLAHLTSGQHGPQCKRRRQNRIPLVRQNKCGSCPPPRYCNRRNKCVLWNQLCNEDNCNGRCVRNRCRGRPRCKGCPRRQCVNGRCQGRPNTRPRSDIPRPPIRPGAQGQCDPNLCRPPNFCDGNLCRSPAPPTPQGCRATCPGGHCVNEVCFPHPSPPHPDFLGGPFDTGLFLTGPPWGFNHFVHDVVQPTENLNRVTQDNGNDYDDDIQGDLVEYTCDQNNLCPFPQNCIRGVCRDIVCNPKYGNSYCPKFSTCSTQRICVQNYDNNNQKVRCNELNCPGRCVNNICHIRDSNPGVTNRQSNYNSNNEPEIQNDNGENTDGEADEDKITSPDDQHEDDESGQSVDDDSEGKFEPPTNGDADGNEQTVKDAVQTIIECNDATCPPPAECVKNVCQLDGYYQPFKVPPPTPDEEEYDENEQGDSTEEIGGDYHNVCNPSNCPRHKRCMGNRCTNIYCDPDLNLFTCPTFSVCSRHKVCVRDPNYQGEPVHPVRCSRSNCPGFCTSNNQCIMNGHELLGLETTFECNPNVPNPCLPGEHCVDGKCLRFTVDPMPQNPNKGNNHVQRHGSGQLVQQQQRHPTGQDREICLNGVCAHGDPLPPSPGNIPNQQGNHNNIQAQGQNQQQSPNGQYQPRPAQQQRVHQVHVQYQQRHQQQRPQQQQHYYNGQYQHNGQYQYHNQYQYQHRNQYQYHGQYQQQQQQQQIHGQHHGQQQPQQPRPIQHHQQYQQPSQHIQQPRLNLQQQHLQQQHIYDTSPAKTPNQQHIRQIHQATSNQNHPRQIHQATPNQNPPRQVYQANSNQNPPRQIHEAAHSQIPPRQIHQAKPNQNSPRPIHQAKPKQPKQVPLQLELNQPVSNIALPSGYNGPYQGPQQQLIYGNQGFEHVIPPFYGPPLAPPPAIHWGGGVIGPVVHGYYSKK